MGILSSWSAHISRTKDLFYIPHFNYLRGDSSIDCTYPLSSVIALCSAKIHESHFGSWAKLTHERIKHVGAFYEFKGPVWIVAGTAFPQIIKIIGIVGSTLVGGLIVSLITHKMQVSGKSRDREESSHSHIPSLALGIIAGIGSGVIAYKLLEKIIPATRGIFFYNFPSFKK